MPKPTDFLRRTTLVLAALFLVAAPSPAQQQNPALTKQAVLTALGQQRLLQEPALHLTTRPWPAQPGTFVALVYLTTSSASLDSGSEAVRAPRLQPTLALLRFVDGQLTAVAQSNPPDALGEPCRELSLVQKDPALGSGFGDPDGTRCVDFHFDLAPYRITLTETAIGVRTKIHSIYPAGESDSENLTLFAIDAHHLKPVFNEEMAGSYEERGPNEMLTSKATLQVGPQETGDHFDLFMLEHDRTDKLVEDGGGHPGKSLARRRFAWNGSTYKELKKK